MSRDKSGRRRPDASFEALGPRIKTIRTERGMTLRDLEVASKVSRAMISKVERGEKSPTFRVLVAIAKGFGVSTSRLIGATPSSRITELTRKAKRVSFRDSETGFERHLLSPDHPDHRFELVMHVMPPGQSTGELPVYENPTDKYIVIEEGEIQLRIGAEVFELSKGDSIYFFLNRPYGFTNVSKKLCRYYIASVTR
jgi:transcriptional regulator with XRE-family HTH domain